MAWEARLGLKLLQAGVVHQVLKGLNGLGSPSGIETPTKLATTVLLFLG